MNEHVLLLIKVLGVLGALYVGLYAVMLIGWFLL